jgi:hypothetical protein
MEARSSTGAISRRVDARRALAQMLADVVELDAGLRFAGGRHFSLPAQLPDRP